MTPQLLVSEVGTMAWPQRDDLILSDWEVTLTNQTNAVKDGES